MYKIYEQFCILCTLISILLAQINVLWTERSVSFAHISIFWTKMSGAQMGILVSSIPITHLWHNAYLFQQNAKKRLSFSLQNVKLWPKKHKF